MELKHTHKRIIAKVDIEQKNYHTFSSGETIRLERDYNNFNRRDTQQVLGEVVSAEHVPSGALLLFNHNCAHPSNEIFNHNNLSGEEIASGIKLYSLPEPECYLWKMPNEPEWKATKGFDTALRIFVPYLGNLEGIEHKKMTDVLFVTSGELKNNAVKTLKACDYAIIFRNEKGVEEQIIRFRPFGDIETKREEEAIAILHDVTDKVLNGEYYVGVNVSDAKPLKNEIKSTTTNALVANTSAG